MDRMLMMQNMQAGNKTAEPIFNQIEEFKSLNRNFLQ